MVVDLRMTKPAKKALIQLMINVCGIIIAMLPFIMPIMPSIAAGSVMGLGAACPRPSGPLFRKAPFLYALTSWVFLVSKTDEDKTAEALFRRLIPRISD